MYFEALLKIDVNYLYFGTNILGECLKESD